MQKNTTMRTSEFKDLPIKNGVIRLINSFKLQIEKRLGQNFNTFRPISYQSQYVGGTLHRLRIEVDGGRHILVIINEEPPISNCNRSLQDVNFVQ